MTPKNIQIRSALRSDLPVLNKIIKASKMHWGYPSEWWDHWEKDTLLKEPDFTTGFIFVLELDNSIEGVCTIFEEKNHYGIEHLYEIEHLFIRPSTIGKGLGKTLLAESLRRAITKEKPVVVVADPNALSFYQKQGFFQFSQVASKPAGRYLPVLKMRN